MRTARYASKRRQMVYPEHQSQNQLPTGMMCIDENFLKLIKVVGDISVCACDWQTAKTEWNVLKQ